jgi:hypothetical protein
MLSEHYLWIQLKTGGELPRKPLLPASGRIAATFKVPGCGIGRVKREPGWVNFLNISPWSRFFLKFLKMPGLPPQR